MNLATGQLEAGDRVRCVKRGTARTYLTDGKEYVVRSVIGNMIYIIDNSDEVGGWFARRFKPIVRVKAPTRRGCCNKGCNGCGDFAFRAKLHRFATADL